MCSNKYLIFLFSLFCVLQISIGVDIVPSHQLPTELFKPIKPNAGASDSVEPDNTRSGSIPTIQTPQTFYPRQQSLTAPKPIFEQRFDPPAFRQDQGLNRPEIIRHNNFIELGSPQPSFNVPDTNQNGFVQRTYTIPSGQNQPSYTVTTYQSPNYQRTWSWSSDGGRTENLSSDGPVPFRIPNGIGLNDLLFEDNFGDAFKNMPFGEAQTYRTGYHTVRTTGPDGRTREKTTVW